MDQRFAYIPDADSSLATWCLFIVVMIIGALILIWFLRLALEEFTDDSNTTWLELSYMKGGRENVRKILENANNKIKGKAFSKNQKKRARQQRIVFNTLANELINEDPNDDKEELYFLTRRLNSQMLNDIRNYPEVYNEHLRDIQNHIDLIDEVATIPLQHIPENRIDNATRHKLSTNKKDNTRAEAINEFLEEERKVVNDPDNVHDTTLNEQLRKYIEDIIEDNNRFPDIPIVNFHNIRKIYKESSDDRKHNVLKVLDKFTNLTNSFTGGYSEIEILQQVWKRQNIPPNTNNSAQLFNSITDLLNQCYEGKDNIKCVNGRVTRMIQSLHLIDYLDYLGEFKTRDIYKNEILDKASHIINKKLHEYAQSEDLKLREAAQLFLGITNDAEPDVQLLRETLIPILDTEIFSEYVGLVNGKTLNDFRREVLICLE
jgi:hypothetical protein